MYNVVNRLMTARVLREAFHAWFSMRARTMEKILTWLCQMALALASSSAAPSKYLITLCTAAQQSDEPFGVAVRIGSSDSKFNPVTSKVIHSILTFSPAPDTMAVEFLNELRKVTGITTLGKWSLYSCRVLLKHESE